MRILMVCPSYQPQEIACGVGDYSRLVADGLAEIGEQVEVLCGSGYRGPEDGPVLVRPVVTSWSGAALRHRLAQESGFDIVDLQYTPELYGARSALRLLPAVALLRGRGTPSVLTLHSLAGRALSSRASAALLVATATHAISANEEVTSMLRKRAPLLARKTTEVPIGSNVAVAAAGDEELRAARRAAGAGRDDPLLVHFGLVYPGKGLETLLAAFRLVLERLPAARLAIVGETRDQSRAYRTGLDDLVRTLGVGEALSWTGKLPPPQVSALLQTTDVYVVPYDAGVSIRRGTLMAGLAHGLPIVSTTPAVPSAYLRDGDNVSLVPPRDAAALAGRILELLEHPDRARRLGAGARTLSESFAWPRIAEATREVFAEVLAR